ncbi:hypothetical protein J6590_005387 [Homalodisca vitripennis]|nr:hypothetical protein J6590_005387 [Homalodisca vitripennis]
MSKHSVERERERASKSCETQHKCPSSVCRFMYRNVPGDSTYCLVLYGNRRTDADGDLASPSLLNFQALNLSKLDNKIPCSHPLSDHLA